MKLHDREAFTIPANTAQASPVSQPLSLPHAYVYSIRWRVPPGPWGLMGWQLQRSGKVWIPVIGTTPWVVADDEYDTIEVDDEIGAGAFVLFGYNVSGFHAHTVYLDIQYETIADYLASQASPVAGLVSLAPASSLSALVAELGGLGAAPTPSPTPPPPLGPTPPPVAPSPTTAGVAWNNQRVTLITVDPKDSSVWWLVTTEPKARHKVASVADANTYQAAGVPQATLSAAELDSYPITTLSGILTAPAK